MYVILFLVIILNHFVFPIITDILSTTPIASGYSHVPLCVYRISNFYGIAYKSINNNISINVKVYNISNDELVVDRSIDGFGYNVSVTGDDVDCVVVGEDCDDQKVVFSYRRINENHEQCLFVKIYDELLNETGKYTVSCPNNKQIVDPVIGNVNNEKVIVVYTEMNYNNEGCLYKTFIGMNGDVETPTIISCFLQDPSVANGHVNSLVVLDEMIIILWEIDTGSQFDIKRILLHLNGSIIEDESTECHLNEGKFHAPSIATNIDKSIVNIVIEHNYQDTFYDIVLKRYEVNGKSLNYVEEYLISDANGYDPFVSPSSCNNTFLISFIEDDILYVKSDDGDTTYDYVEVDTNVNVASRPELSIIYDDKAVLIYKKYDDVYATIIRTNNPINYTVENSDRYSYCYSSDEYSESSLYISSSSTSSFSGDDDISGGDDGMLYLYISLGSVALCLIIIIITLIIVLIIIAIMKKKKNDLHIPFVNGSKKEDFKFTVDEDLFKIDYKNIKLIDLIGSGGSDSQVYKAKWNGEIVAFKQFKLYSFGGAETNYLDSFGNEVRVCLSLNHPNILRFYGCSYKVPRIGIVMEYCRNGDLYCMIFKSDQEKKPFLMKDKLQILKQICSGMQYIHNRNLMHRDLKSLNVLLADDLKVKIADFGLTKIVRSINDLHSNRVGTTQYMAPEILSGKYDEKIDIFSMSIIIYEVMSGTKPYKEKKDEYFDVCLRVSNDPEFRPVIDHEIFIGFDEIKEIMIRSWSDDPNARPNFTQIGNVFQHSYLNFIRKTRKEKTKKHY